MKKCIASFLICFVFAFGVISAFGCREVVCASDTGSYLIVSGTRNSDNLGLESYFNCPALPDNCIYLPCFFEKNTEGTRPIFIFIVASTESYVSSDGFTYTNTYSNGDSFTYHMAQLNQFVHNGFYITALYGDTYYDDEYTNSYLARHYDAIYNSYYIEEHIEEIIPLMQGFSWTKSEPEFSKDIGYLSNLTVKQKNYENNATHQISRRVYSFSWGYESSTGVDLSDSRYLLEIKAQIKYKDLAFDDISIDDSPLCNTFKYDSDWTELHNSATNCLEAYNSDSIFSRSGFGTTYYFRIVDTESNLCGNWLKAYIDFDGVLNVSLVEETGDFDESGSWVGDGNEFNGSGGVQNGDNESTYVPSDSSSKLDYSGIGDGVSSLVDGVGQVPSVISMLLSWLPNWVIIFLSVSIAIWGIMIVKKAIFG